MDISKIKSKLIPCIDSKRNLFAQMPTFAPRNCGQCHCWFSNNSDVWFEPEEHFPKEKLSIDGTIRMTKLDYKHLCEVVNTTHDKVVEGEWTTGEAQAYLSTNCFNTIARDEIMKCATNCKLKRNAERDHDMATLESILVLQQDNPNQYEKWQVPPMWKSGLSLQQSAEPCMHQLFLGVVKDLTLDIQD